MNKLLRVDTSENTVGVPYRCSGSLHRKLQSNSQASCFAVNVRLRPLVTRPALFGPRRTVCETRCFTTLAVCLRLCHWPFAL